MDRETLRKQLYEELYLQFDAKLQEAKRQKSQLEEEMEASSEKWRTERRRLHSEIDKLETKLVETREVRRKATGATAGRMVEAQELAKVKAAAEESLKRAAEDFEADRAKLQAEISRLQSGIAELIERSNNPLRASQLEKEKFESKLEDTVRAKRHAEDSLQAAKSDWEEEKLKLVTEITQLRRSSLQVKSLKTKQDEEHTERLERQLQEAVRLRDALAADLEKAKHETSKLKQSHLEDRDRLAGQLDSTKKENSGLEKQLRDANVAREKLERETERMREAAATMKSGQSESTARMKEELEDARAEAKAAARRVDEAKSAAAKERAALEKQVRDSSMAQEKLERELDNLRQAPASLKEVHLAEITRLRGELESARAESKVAEARLDEVKTAALKERASLEKQLREASHSHERIDREASADSLKDAQAAEVSRLKTELDTARADAKIADARLEEFKIAGTRLRAGLEKQLQDAAEAQEKLLRELDKFKQAADTRADDQSLVAARSKELEAALAEAKAMAATNQGHIATIDQLNKELAEARDAIKRLQLEKDEAGKKINSEIVEQLRRQYEERMQELINQKSELTNELRSATSALEEERIKLETSANSSNGSESVDVQVINAEVTRVQEVIAGITQLMNDPETELSTVIRKNVERAELDAYLKGILFSLGRGDGL